MEEDKDEAKNHTYKSDFNKGNDTFDKNHDGSLNRWLIPSQISQFFHVVVSGFI